MAETWQYVYIFAVFASALISAALTAYAWRRRDRPGATAFAAMMLTVTVWTSASSLRILSSTPQAARVSWNLIFFGLATTPVTFLVFVLEYTGRGTWLTRARLAALFAIPAVTQVIVWTSRVPGVFFQSMTFAPGGLSTAPDAITWGPWFSVHTAYSYGLTILSVVLIVLTLGHASRLYRRQAVALLVSAAFPLTANVIVTFELIPGVNVHLSSIGFAVTGVVLGWAIFRHRLLEVVPIARNALIDGMSDGMLVLDAQEQIVDLNPAMQAILAGEQRGSTKTQVLGRPAATVLGVWPDLVPFLQGEGRTQAEITLPQGKTRRHYDLRVSALRDPRGRFSGKLVVLRDITARKQAETALRQYTTELEASNAELDAFAHTVAHDLKDPLSVVVAYSSLLEMQYDEMDPAKAREGLRRLSETAYKMSSIIDELLLLASVRKMSEIAVGPLDTAAIVAEACKRLESQITSTGAEVIVPDAAAWPVAAVGYAPWVEEVWVNYLSNAVKYGGAPPRVQVGATERPDGTVRFWVRDNGAGLTPEQQAQLFTQFTRLHEIRAEGYGLGLTIVERIVDKLGGEAGVESQVGEGSTFYFTLPRTAPAP